MVKDSSIQAFFGLLKSGLWGKAGANLNVDLNLNEGLNWDKVYQLAQEQSVQGVVLQGIEWFKNHNLNADLGLNIPRVLLLQWIGEVQAIEHQNKDMNVFIADLIEKLRKADVHAILVKGQGIARCYDKPLWRCPGDVDLLLSEENYIKAKVALNKIAESSERETAKNIERQHQEFMIDGWPVELHGTMHANLSRKIDKEIDRVQQEVLCRGKARSWIVRGSSKGVQVFLPAPDEDVIFVFAHILQHLFLEGIGLRQICDWCRLLYTYRDSLDMRRLESRIKAMGLVTEWKVFYNLASRYLGMPDYGSGFMVRDSRFDRKAERLMRFILEVGNFGHNRKVEWSNPLKRRASLIWHRITDTFKLSLVFPIDAPKFLLNYAVDGVKGLVRGE